VRGSLNGELLGLFSVFHPDDRGPSDAELPLLARSQHLAAIAMERTRFETRLEHQALHDSLTGLPNRTLLLDRLEHALARSRRTDRAVAVLFVDLDRFKVINDSLGHAAGDDLLQQVGKRYAAAVPASDTVGRFGGDEFVVLCEDMEGEAGAVDMAERLAAVMEQPFMLTDAGAEVVVSCSIGIALAHGRAVSSDALVRDADAAMYRAKDEGRNRYALFEPQLHRRMVRRLELERDLRLGLARDELRVAYQPIVRLADGRITGIEALVRWERPGHGLVGAADFVPLAEETGLIVPVGAWVLRAACEQVVAWDRAVDPLGLSVNLSARQLADPSLVGMVEQTLRETGMAPDRLCLEVTESALASDADTAVVALAALKELGVRLAIDDFGTGYATLDYVRRFSMADELKIDRSFVAGLTDVHVPDAAIVSASIVLANALGFDTVAEGVENAEQLAVLRRLGCQYAQGYWFSRPVAAEDLVPLLPPR
jgi:diguanylate cyclase (GGDEF)-like protein